MLPSLLTLPLLFHTVIATSCRSNGDCATGSKCFFGDEDPSRNGSCRMIKDLRHNYFNAMFSDLISNSVGKIPADLFYPQSNKSCETSRNCEYSEVCMISAKNVSSNEEIQKHCYKKSPYWTTVPKWITDSIKPCNSNSQCSNNFCVKMGGKITKFESKTVWNTEKVIIWSPTIFENSKKTMKNATIFLDETDRKNRKWKLEVAGSEIFQKNMSGCFFSFQKLGDSHSTPIRIRSARLNCLEELDEAIYADIEIFGETLTTNTESMKFEGLCGHPGLNCINCLVDNQLFPCKEDRDCYDVGSRDWIIRNEKPSCSSYVYSGQRLCKREKFTCPPDSLNSDGAIPPSGKLCEADADCKNMTSFVDLPNLKANYYPHCFNGLCCARRELCVREDILPYALPVESNGESEACFKDEDCVMFPGSRGSCEVARLLTTKLSFRERFYINDSAKAYKYDYGMCCYNERLLCSPGTTPFEVELVDGGCSEHMDCNPYLKPFEWNSYCSENKTCCRGKTSEYMCPDGFTPYPNEPKCDGYNRIIEYSGNCPNENGMCYKGHCCPRLMVDTQNIATPWHSNYETNSSCDPTEPLDAVYQWAYCDEETEKIVVLGNRSWDGGDEVEWEMRRCSVNSDCDNPKYLCVHISYGLRYCVLSHKFKPENSQLDSWTLTIGIISLFIGIIIVITWTPISVFQ